MERACWDAREAPIGKHSTGTTLPNDRKCALPPLRNNPTEKTCPTVETDLYGRLLRMMGLAPRMAYRPDIVRISAMSTTQDRNDDQAFTRTPLLASHLLNTKGAALKGEIKVSVKI